MAIGLATRLLSWRTCVHVGALWDRHRSVGPEGHVDGTIKYTTSLLISDLSTELECADL